MLKHITKISIIRRILYWQLNKQTNRTKLKNPEINLIAHGNLDHDKGSV